MGRYMISIGSSCLRIRPTLSDEDTKALSEELRYRVEGYQFTPAYRNRGWDGYKSLYNRYRQEAPVGLYDKIGRVLKARGHEVAYDRDYDYPPSKTKPYVRGLELYDLQREAVRLALKYRIGIIQAPVRAGKTAILGALINVIRHYPVCVVTKDKDLVYQTQQALLKFTGMPVGTFVESVWNPEEDARVVVTHYTALCTVFNKRPGRRGRVSPEIEERNQKVREFVRSTKVLLLDECHASLATATNRVLGFFGRAGYRIGVSGTPFPENLPKIAAKATLGPVIMQVNYSELVDRGRLAQPEVYAYDLPVSWYSHYLTEFSDIYQANIVRNVRRNAFIAHVVEELRKRGKTCYIMVSKIEHGERLQRIIPGSVYVSGRVRTPVRFNLYEAIKDKRIHCIIGTVGKVGLDLPSLDAVINAEGNKSRVGTIQKLRSLTACTGKTKGMVIDFLDKGKYLDKHSEKRVHRYGTMRGAKIHQRAVPSQFLEGQDGSRSPEEASASCSDDLLPCGPDERPSGVAYPWGAGEAAAAEPSPEDVCGEVGGVGQPEGD